MAAVSAAQVEQFEQDGFLILRGALDPKVASEIEAKLEEIRTTRGPGLTAVDASYARVAPMAGEPFSKLTTDDLRSWLDTMIGKDEYAIPPRHGAFACALPEKERSAVMTATYYGNWHIDRLDRAVSLLDDLALTPLWLFSDCAPNGGGTKLIRGSHRDMARMLAGYGPLKNIAMASFCDNYAINKTSRMVEFHGKAGDVVLMHPFLIHTATPNLTSRLRWICNTGIRRTRKLTVPDILTSSSPVDRAIAGEVRFAHHASSGRMHVANLAVEVAGSVRRIVGGTRDYPFHQEPTVRGPRRWLYMTMSKAGAALTDEMTAPLGPIGLSRWPAWPT